MIIEIRDDKNPITLREAISRMEWISKQGFSCYLEGAGNKNVRIVFERGEDEM